MSGNQQAGELGKGSYGYHGRTYGFGLSTLRRHPAIAPIVIIIGGVIVGVTAFSTYSLATKLDVQVDKSRRWEKLDLTKPQPTKMFTIQQEYRAMPELHQLLREIDEADRK